MALTKDIEQKITDTLYRELHALPSVDIMRCEVRKMFIPRYLWDKWYGCRFVKKGDSYYIYHKVALSFVGLDVKGEDEK